MYQTSEKRSSFLYTLLIMFLFMIPNYFAIKATLEQEENINKLELMQWVTEVERYIYTENGELPKSVKFKIALYDYNHNKIISNLINEPENLIFETYTDYPYMYYQKNIDINKYNVAYIVSETKINHSKVILTTAVLFLVILLIIYVFSRILIRNTATPYKLMQKYMNDFFNDAMHELKTPLGVININLELMGPSIKQTKHIKRIKAATKQMQMTYEDLEYYIKNKKTKYSKEQINLSEYLKSRVVFFEDIASSKSIKIDCTIDDDIVVYINKVEIQRIIDNTISNAIKYSNFEGNIEINLSKDEDRCTFFVKDFGQGIKDTKAIFKRFTREDSIQGGFGLGLNIVQNICNKNNIEIIIDSKVGEGSTFKYKIELYKRKFLDYAENEK